MLATNGVKEGLAVFNVAHGQQIATLNVLFHQEPEDGAPFIEVREWCTTEEDAYELIAEWGHVEGDDLVTQCAVLPGYYGLAQALTYVNEQLATARA